MDCGHRKWNEFKNQYRCYDVGTVRATCIITTSLCDTQKLEI